tara:strand:- start:337 stop:498 length:162 start_codon:yes stop_codon:yes gene_type:complete
VHRKLRHKKFTWLFDAEIVAPGAMGTALGDPAMEATYEHSQIFLFLFTIYFLI